MAREATPTPTADPQEDPGTPPEHRFEEGEEAPPPGVRAMAIVRWLLLLAVVAAAFFSIYTYAAPLLGQGPAGGQKAHRYFCPMHPQTTSDHPGECPICHMALEPMPERGSPAPSAPAPAPSAAAPARARAAAPKGSETQGGYTCPMHPQVHSEGPGRCPVCKMDLVPVAAAAPGPKAEPAPAASAAPPDTAPVTLSLDRVQAIGVRTALVERRPAAEALRATAAVEVPEQGRAEVHVRAPGYVESISVRDVGVKVKAGEPLVAVYSPEVLQAQQELLTVRSWAAPEGPSSSPGLPPPPAAAARRKLELLGVGAGTIDRIVAAGQPLRAIGVASPISGYVTKKDVVLGSYVMPDKVLFEVADLGRVYVVASLYPHQLASVRAGDEATFTTPSLPGRAFTSKVDLIHPEVDLATRTARVRFRVDNKDLALRPGQFGTVELRGKGVEALAIPMDAVVDTGRSVYVFLALDGGRFEARTVELGEQVGDRFVVRSGLQEGQRVVSGATFLIDAESRLQASMAASAGAAGSP